jgi:hypothetical protein
MLEIAEGENLFFICSRIKSLASAEISIVRHIIIQCCLSVVVTLKNTLCIVMI